MTLRCKAFLTSYNQGGNIDKSSDKASHPLDGKPPMDVACAYCKKVPVNGEPLEVL
jgi:hypothetical protein